MSSVPCFIGHKSTVIVAQVYNASNNELVRTNTLVKGAIIQIDAAPFRQWYEAHVRFLFGGGLCKEDETLIKVDSTPNQ